MAATTSVSYINRLIKHRSFKTASLLSSSSSILCFKIVVSPRISLLVSKTKPNFTTTSTSAFRSLDSDNNSNEVVQALEQENVIDGSSSHLNLVLHGVESTIKSLSRWILFGIFSGFIVWRHDAEALWFAVGSSLNTELSVKLKHILNQERPSNLKSDPGMPSSHAQTIFFLAMYAIISGLKRGGMNVFSITLSGLALAFCSYFSYLRVSQQLHTVSQVVVGGAIGTVFCFLWYWLLNAFIIKAILLKTIGLLVAGYTLYSNLQRLKEE